ncbi:hypothetical protein KOI35_00015 [Actinoplanes bogorensis]|uniref:DUF4190 domain-containing protein n=1 Tax=Paractinoplanes bogorensis TaxID=1610840 RepID=A0ABS5YEQ7_9ACTN|nr:hypothetical protein [Actinoplanes bogorensis]MBU2661880.1 hypothetical protein [Actinoplanes bogorensis]
MRIPTFSRQTTSDTTETTERPTATGTGSATTRPAATGTVTRPRSDNTTEIRPRRDEEDTLTDLPPAPPTATRRDAPPPPPPAVTTTRPSGSATVEKPEAPLGPKPRASFLATLGLILGVASVLLVLSGPLMGYGIGLAGLALILSLSGIHATGKRHVAGKGNALLGMVFSLGAIVLGVLALTGSLNWLGTDIPAVDNARVWLDAQFINRF